MKGKRAIKRIPKKEESVRKVIPISIITVKDKYRKTILKNVKDKHAKSLSDAVVFEIMMKCLRQIPEKEYLKQIPKKYLR